MKSSNISSFLTIVTLAVALSFSLGNPKAVNAGDHNRSFISAWYSSKTNDRPAAGYLRVYSATDEYNDDGVEYYAHSSYVIYTGAGNILKNVENHVSRTDETPELVVLPVGSYTIEARSESRGYVRLRVFVKSGVVTTLDLDSREQSRPFVHLAVD